VNAGLTILESGQPVGITKSSCWSPTLESGVGYVVFDQGLSNGETWVGKTLTIEDAAGDEHDCEIVTLPFFDKEKKIPRGLSPELG
jgi:aminomethyltransferase